MNKVKNLAINIVLSLSLLGIVSIGMARANATGYSPSDASSFNPVDIPLGSKGGGGFEDAPVGTRIRTAEGCSTLGEGWTHINSIPNLYLITYRRGIGSEGTTSNGNGTYITQKRELSPTEASKNEVYRGKIPYYVLKDNGQNYVVLHDSMEEIRDLLSDHPKNDRNIYYFNTNCIKYKK